MTNIFPGNGDNGDNDSGSDDSSPVTLDDGAPVPSDDSGVTSVMTVESTDEGGSDCETAIINYDDGSSSSATQNLDTGEVVDVSYVGPGESVSDDGGSSDPDDN